MNGTVLPHCIQVSLLKCWFTMFTSVLTSNCKSKNLCMSVCMLFAYLKNSSSDLLYILLLRTEGKKYIVEFGANWCTTCFSVKLGSHYWIFLNNFMSDIKEQFHRFSNLKHTHGKIFKIIVHHYTADKLSHQREHCTGSCDVMGKQT